MPAQCHYTPVMMPLQSLATTLVRMVVVINFTCSKHCEDWLRLERNTTAGRMGVDLSVNTHIIHRSSSCHLSTAIFWPVKEFSHTMNANKDGTSFIPTKREAM
jgi:hypothetical protein